MHAENILRLIALSDISKRILAEFEYPEGPGEILAPTVNIAPEGETVIVVPKVAAHLEAVKPYKGGADIEWDITEGDTDTLTTRLWTIGHLLLPETYDGWKRAGKSPAEVDAMTAADARAKFNTKRESVIATFLNAAGNYDNTSGATNKWDTANGTPLDDFQLMIIALDFTPTAVCMSQAVYFAMLTGNTQFKEYFKGFTIGTKEVVRDMLAAYVGITGLELYVDDSKGYIPRWATSVTATKLYDANVVMVHNSPGLKGAFLANGAPVSAFAVTATTKGAVYPREGWVQLPEKGNAAGFVIQDYFKVKKLNGAAGYLLTAAI